MSFGIKIFIISRLNHWMTNKVYNKKKSNDKMENDWLYEFQQYIKKFAALIVLICLIILILIVLF